MSVRVVLAALALAPAPRLEPAEVLEIAEQSDERDRLVSPLRPREGGGYDYSDPKGRFNAVIQPDGRVTISLPPALRGGLCLGALNCVVVEDLWDYLRSPEKWQPQLSSTQEWMAMHGAPVVFGFSTLALGALEMPMRPPFIGVGGSFGRRFAPRRAIMDFMRHTFEMRLGLAAAAQRDLIAYELSRLDDELDALWAESLEAARRSPRPALRAVGPMPRGHTPRGRALRRPRDRPRPDPPPSRRRGPPQDRKICPQERPLGRS
jgi:hypothetical protein